MAFGAALEHDGVAMRYRRAVDKLQELARACERVKDWPPEDPFLVSVYVFGDVLDGVDALDNVQVAVAINLAPEEVPWGSSPHGTQWLADQLRLSKGGFEYWWRSHMDPVWNHCIRGPVRSGVAVNAGPSNGTVRRDDRAEGSGSGPAVTLRSF